MTQAGVPEARFYSTGQAVDFENYRITSQQQITYQETNQMGQGGSSTYSLGFTLSGATSFQNIFSASLSNQQSLQWTNKWSELTTSMTGQTATAHITEPGSNIQYSGPNAAIQFGVFQDNVYGTFMFYPTEW